jgi:predicted nucleic acid-binding protein
MTLAGLASGERVFLDANVLIYHFSSHPVFGVACRGLIERIEQGDVLAFTSTHIISEVSHRMMILEAANLPGWGTINIRRRLQQKPQTIGSLSLFRNAVQAIISSSVRVLTPAPQVVLDSTTASQQHLLLSNDALTVALMQDQGLTNLASGDADFDRVPWIKRFAPA